LGRWFNTLLGELLDDDPFVVPEENPKTGLVIKDDGCSSDNDEDPTELNTSQVNIASFNARIQAFLNFLGPWARGIGTTDAFLALKSQDQQPVIMTTLYISLLRANSEILGKSPLSFVPDAVNVILGTLVSILKTCSCCQN
jgi:hypothetical protein